MLNGDVRPVRTGTPQVGHVVRDPRTLQSHTLVSRPCMPGRCNSPRRCNGGGPCMPNHLPWFPFFATDWIADAQVRSMTAEQRGIYVDLLAWQWREGSLPVDEEQVAAMLGLASGVARAKRGATDTCSYDPLVAVLTHHFPAEDGKRRNPRLDAIRLEQEAAHLAQSSAGKQGRLKQLRRSRGGPRLARGKPRRSPGEARQEVESEVESEERTTKARTRAEAPESWLAPFGLAWQELVGEQVPWKKLTILRPVALKYGAVHTAAAFRRYLSALAAKNEVNFASAARFAATTTQWGLGAEPALRPDLYQTADEADRKAGILP